MKIYKRDEKQIKDGQNCAYYKILDGVAFIIIQGIIIGLFSILSMTYNIIDSFIEIVNDNKIIEQQFWMKLFSLINHIQYIEFKKFIITLFISLLLSVVITFIILKIFKNSTNPGNIVYIIGISSIVTIPFILLMFIFYLANIKIVVCLDTICMILCYFIIIQKNYKKIGK